MFNRIHIHWQTKYLTVTTSCSFSSKNHSRYRNQCSKTWLEGDNNNKKKTQTKEGKERNKNKTPRPEKKERGKTSLTHNLKLCKRISKLESLPPNIHSFQLWCCWLHTDSFTLNSASPRFIYRSMPLDSRGGSRQLCCMDICYTFVNNFMLEYYHSK